MPFGVMGRLGPRMSQLDGVAIVRWEGAILGVDVGHPIVTNGDLLLSCVNVCEVIAAVGVVGRVGPVTGVLDGVHIPQGEGEVLWVFLVHWFEWHF